MPTKTPPTAEQITNAIRSGSTDYSHEDLAAARAREEFEQLQAEARSREELQQLAEQRDRDIAQARAEIEHLADDSADQLAHVAAANAALTALVESSRARANRIADLGDQLRRLQVGELRNGELDGGSVGWRLDPDTRKINTLRVGDRVLRAVDPAVLVAKAVGEFTAANRLNPRKLPHQTTTDLITGQDTVITPPATVPVRLTRPWGNHRVGQTVAVDPEIGRWLVERQGAERA